MATVNTSPGGDNTSPTCLLICLNRGDERAREEAARRDNGRSRGLFGRGGGGGCWSGENLLA